MRSHSLLCSGARACSDFVLNPSRTDTIFLAKVRSLRKSVGAEKVKGRFRWVKEALSVVGHTSFQTSGETFFPEKKGSSVNCLKTHLKICEVYTIAEQIKP